jgi:hypothetical protein
MATTTITSSHLAHPADDWDSEPHRLPLGPDEPLDDCPDCYGAVQRWARHAQGLGELWETPLDINVIDQPYSPRLPGPGFLSTAFAARSKAVAV